MTNSPTTWRSLGALGVAALMLACAETPTTFEQPFRAGPEFHIIPIANPEVELVALCKAGPAGTYSFSATASHPVLRNETTGAFNQTSGTYSITVTPTSTINVGGNVISGACYNYDGANGVDHNHLAVAGGSTDASVTFVEVTIPTGIRFVKADVYQRTGGVSGPVTASSSTTNSATVRLGGLGSSSTLMGGNAVFYNEMIPQPSLVISKTADAAKANAGTTIGFAITVTSNGPGTANGVTLNDPLPTGNGITWAIDSQPAGTPCAITSGVLNCAFGDLAAGTSVTVHVMSPTSSSSCGDYPNTASAGASNHENVSASAATKVECPSLSIVKTADATSTMAGGAIGFGVTVTSNGPGVATGVTVTDPLPAGSGIVWSIDAQPTGNPCVIVSNTLNCSFGDMPAGTSATVHVTSPTTTASCATYPNTATARATNHAAVSASAATSVVCPPPPASVLLIIDEDGIDNGLHFNSSGGGITPSGPQFFGVQDVNDDKPGKTQRSVLRYFQSNIGRTITVRTGQTGDEGWFAPNCIPAKWAGGSSTNDTCLTGSARAQGIDNYFGRAGAGAIPAQDRLDKIPHVIPLRALGLNALIGKTVCAVVYDSDVSINYDIGKPLGVNGNLQGETLGIVSFHVNAVRTLNRFSSSTLPEVQITIADASACGNWTLFNAPVPRSSSEPNDRVAPGSTSQYHSLKVWSGQGVFY